MELHRGITGFFDAGAPPSQTRDLRAFRGHCHVAARALGGRVVTTETSADQGVANFIRVALELPCGTLAVLHNLHHPVIAFAAFAPDPGAPPRWVEAPELEGQFRDFGGYQILSAAEAVQPVEPGMCRRLAGVELEQIRYWRPQCVGEVVFN